MRTIELAKYEGVGNDFLLARDDGSVVFDAGLAVALCDRHRGIGADGLIALKADGGHLVMRLWNADGSFAETSGNGLRCAALAALQWGIVSGDSFVVQTDGGEAKIVVEDFHVSGTSTLRASMGTARVTDAPSSPLPGVPAYLVDVGNPHLVLIADRFEGVDLAVVGPQWSTAVPEGQNVELITPGPVADELVLDVYERGVGLTDACGTGSIAGAAVARLRGDVGERVVVHNPGGDVVVAMSGDKRQPQVELAGPVRRIARINIDLDDFEVGKVDTR